MVKIANTGPSISQGLLLIIVMTLFIAGALLSSCERERMNTKKVFSLLLKSPPLTVGGIAERTDLKKGQVRAALLNLHRNGARVVRVDSSLEFSRYVSRHGEQQKWS